MTLHPTPYGVCRGTCQQTADTLSHPTAYELRACKTEGLMTPHIEEGPLNCFPRLVLAIFGWGLKEF